MKVAILGGTFNPIHNGHIALANTAVEAFGLDKVIFVPTYIPPHKQEQHIASADERLDMVKLAINGNDKFKASRLEINRRNVSYSVDTILYIKKIYPKNTDLFFITGSDVLSDLDEWKAVDKILSICRFVVGIRPGSTLDTKYKTIEIFSMVPVDISSSEIRNLIKGNKDIKSMVPEKIAEYIEKHNIYK